MKAIKDDYQKRQFLLAEDLDKIDRNIGEIERRLGGTVGLITMDPITAYMGGKIDAHKVTEVRSQLGPLKDFAERANIAVSAVTHPAKNPGKRAIRSSSRTSTAKRGIRPTSERIRRRIEAPSTCKWS